jgi:hypothetical protein
VIFICINDQHRDAGVTHRSKAEAISLTRSIGSAGGTRATRGSAHKLHGEPIISQLGAIHLCDGHVCGALGIKGNDAAFRH